MFAYALYGSMAIISFIYLFHSLLFPCAFDTVAARERTSVFYESFESRVVQIFFASDSLFVLRSREAFII